MVWRNLVGDPVDGEGESRNDGRTQEPAAPFGSLLEDARLEQETPDAEIAVLSLADLDLTLRDVESGLAGLMSRVG